MSNVTQLLFFLTVLQLPHLYLTDEVRSIPYDWNTPKGLQISNNPFSPSRNLLKAIQQNRGIKSFAGEGEDGIPLKNSLEQPDITNILSNDPPITGSYRKSSMSRRNQPNVNNYAQNNLMSNFESATPHNGDDSRPNGINFEVENGFQGAGTYNPLMNPHLARNRNLPRPPARFRNSIRSPSAPLIHNGGLRNQPLPRTNQNFPSQPTKMRTIFEKFTQPEPLTQPPDLEEFIPLPFQSPPPRNKGDLPRHIPMSFPPPSPAYKERLQRQAPISFPPLPFRNRGHFPRRVPLQFPPPPYRYKGHFLRRAPFPFPPPPFGFRGYFPRRGPLPFQPPPFGFRDHFPRGVPFPFPPPPPFRFRGHFPRRVPFPFPPPPPFGFRGHFPRRAPFPFPSPPFEFRGHSPQHALFSFPPPPFGFRGHFPRRMPLPFPPPPFGFKDDFPFRAPLPFPPPPSRYRGHLPRHVPLPFPTLRFGNIGPFPRSMPKPLTPSPIRYREELPLRVNSPFLIPPPINRRYFPPHAMPLFPRRSPKIPQQLIDDPIFSFDMAPFKRSPNLPFHLQMREGLSHRKLEDPLFRPLKHSRPFFGDSLPGLRPNQDSRPPNSSPYASRDDFQLPFDFERPFQGPQLTL
ncbi:uncharacterized protein LOC133193650 isoform X2 [Saccostrea echinata]|uniref:uncharacterized protein LOC133193650 isoform X2 n=1 Tax=Saccostrea echinata TaxID=191078 RepID=UPI002A83EFD0|nr:uncharacterized protein LOC133193650 isoform X2 [Saccostrea echinata]